MLCIVLLVAAFSACADNAGSAGESDSGNSEPREVVVAYIGIVDQFQYEDEEGNLTGYEIELLKAIDEALPQYNFVFEPYDFQNMLIAVENKKADIAVCQLAKREEREGKYLHSIPYGSNSNVFAALSSNTELIDSITSLDSWGGKIVWSVQGSASSAALETYNAEHPDNPITIEYNATGMEGVISSLQEGALDAMVVDAVTVNQINGAYDGLLTVAGEKLNVETLHFILNIDDTTLLADMDDALQGLLDSGEASGISEAFLEYDITASAR
jgi:ABC-type amino acid transport substrate-binding protein